MKVILFSEDFSIDFHMGQSFSGYGMVLIEENLLIFYSKTNKRFSLTSDPELLERTKRLIAEKVINEGDEDFNGKLVDKVVEVKDVTSNDPIVQLFHQIKSHIEQEKKLLWKFSSFFPGWENED